MPSEKPLLHIENLHVSVSGKQILKGINLTLHKGEVHALMGRNGTGKSTLANVLMGHPAFEVTEGKIVFRGEDVSEMDTTQRARLGMFLSFQHPPEIAGVKVGTFLRKSVGAIREKAPPSREFRKELNEKMETLEMDKSYLNRYVNDGFSGGEKKRLEILQLMMLKPTLAILDETDSGLDIDAMRIVSRGVNQNSENQASLVITHYQRLLNHIKPDHVHVLMDGKIVHSGGEELVDKLEREGYDWLTA